MEYVILSILAIIVIFFAVVLIRALCFKPYEMPVVNADPVEFDKEQAVENLRELIRCKTISSRNKELEDDKEFDKLLNLLPTLYPNIYPNLEVRTFKSRGILLRWKGKTMGKPAVMMSHFDVVPVSEDGWSVPPFEAVIKDGCLWGRGACDTKITLNGAMTAADNLVKQGFVPENDVYFAFSGGEEINGSFVKEAVEYFAEINIE
ncbi:MAG: M20/M25/M40 family metallo-hydrolase, partial [Clostridia bacterium]|nr:M20/M25/M40 family metallo-hydrolase [Clostridia bacterium]